MSAPGFVVRFDIYGNMQLLPTPVVWIDVDRKAELEELGGTCSCAFCTNLTEEEGNALWNGGTLATRGEEGWNYVL